MESTLKKKSVKVKRCALKNQQKKSLAAVKLQGINFKSGRPLRLLCGFRRCL